MGMNHGVEIFLQQTSDCSYVSPVWLWWNHCVHASSQSITFWSQITLHASHLHLLMSVAFDCLSYSLNNLTFYSIHIS